MAANALRIDPAELHQQIQSLQREPFRQFLATLMECQPTRKAIQAFANKSPDRYAQAVSIFQKASGYTDKTVHEHNFYAKILTVSDAELIEQNKELENQLAAKGINPEVIEHLDNPEEPDKLLADTGVPK